MERDFNTDDFERLLRERSDEFRMYPSKRIWYSIYNNIHPGHRWPSVAMCITLISTLLLIGYLNTRNTHSYKNVTIATNKHGNSIFIEQKDISPLNAIAGSETTISKSTAQKVDQALKNGKNAQALNTKKLLLFSVAKKSSTKLFSLDIVKETNISDNNEIGFVAGATIVKSSDKDFKKLNLLSNSSSSPQTDLINEAIKVSKIKSENNSLQNPIDNSWVLLNTLNTGDNDIVNQSNPVLLNTDGKLETSIFVKNILLEADKVKNAISKSGVVTNEDKNWIDNYALYNRPAPKKWANKLEWQNYFTPSVVYRTLYNNTNFDTRILNVSPFAVSASNSTIISDIIQSPSIGFEMGTGLQYLILKGIKIKGAVQFNYSSYNAHAYQNSHPVATKLTMLNFENRTSYEVNRSTPYSNKSGLESVKLHNESFQISIPLGIAFKVIGNDRLQWNIGATLQPTYVLSGKSYLLSADRNNYVKDAGMINRWNLNAGLETFISLKSANGLNWQIGPQFRKQLFSTNSKTFSVTERYVNYGIKFGVSKTLK